MNLQTIFHLLRRIRKCGIWFPFKVYIPVKIKIRNSAKLILNGRLTIGSSDRQKAIVSVNLSNLYFGYTSQTEIGHSVSIGPGVNIIVKDKGKLKIGNGTYFTSDSHIEVCHQTIIGSDCAISWGVTIIDSDHHQLHYADKKTKESNVTIGDKVWIGNNVIILKGSKIGSGSVIAAGSVVNGEFPDKVLIAGNPARIVKQNVDWN